MMTQNIIIKNKIIMKVLTVLITLIVVLLCTASSIVASSGEQDSDNLVVGVPTNRCPVFYLDRDKNTVVGIGVDLMRIVAEEAGYQSVTFEAVEESNLKEALDNQAYDVILPFGSAVSSASGQESIVSENLFQTPFTLVTVNKRKLPPLSQTRVGMLRSLSTAGETISQLYSGVEITFYDTMDESVKALRSGEVDALMHNSYVWSYVLQKPSYADLAVQPSAMFSMDFRVGTLNTAKGHETIERLNIGIEALKDTQRQAVILDYTTRRLYQYDVADYLYVQWPFLLLVAMLIISLIIITILKMQTIRFEQEEKMRYLIDHDSLTGVFSLNGFRKKAEELLRKYPDTQYIISYGNIRNFKYINESLGMEAGNDLLCFWAEKTLNNLSEQDTFGRIEADHFAILRHLEGDEQFNNDTEEVFEPIKNFFINQGEELRVQLCLGIYTLTPEDHQAINIDRMLDYARVAEKKLRDNHQEGFGVYNSEQWKTGKLIADVSSRLPIALQTQEIQVWYQPQVHFETGQIISAEALCRWKHAKRGWISPADFIPALEEAGLIYDLDCFVWEKVCQDLHQWNTEGKNISASVNISRADFAKNENLPEHFLKLIQRYELTPKQLHIEITETAYVKNPDLLITITKKFREYGFRVEMDDFGSGYSSLNMLKEVQVDRIKLDLHFLTETGDSQKGSIIIQYMIQMAQSLGMSIIAEGVEREEQAHFLNQLGCSEMQGYYYYKPMPAEDYRKLID